MPRSNQNPFFKNWPRTLLAEIERSRGLVPRLLHVHFFVGRGPVPRHAKTALPHRRARACPSPCNDRGGNPLGCAYGIRGPRATGKNGPLHRRARACPSPGSGLTKIHSLTLVSDNSRGDREIARDRPSRYRPRTVIFARDRPSRYRPRAVDFARDRPSRYGPRAVIFARDRPSRYRPRAVIFARDRPSRYGPRAVTFARDRPSRYGPRTVVFAKDRPSRYRPRAVIFARDR